MPKALVAGAVIQCSHGGMARLPSGSAKLQVSGQPAVTAGQEVGISFKGGAPNVITPCPWGQHNPPSPCIATQAALTGVSTLLTVGGGGVLLDTASGPAVNATDPAATWSVASAGQSLLDIAH